MISNSGFKIGVDRIARLNPKYTPASRFKVGINQLDPEYSDTDLTLPVPISGIIEVCDCDSVSGWDYTADGNLETTTTNYKKGNYGLSLLKSGSSKNRVVYYFTTDALNFDSQELWGWVYLKQDAIEVIDSLKVGFGSDYDSNYYSFELTGLELGWNVIKFNSSESTEVGSPSLGDCKVLSIDITLKDNSDLLEADDLIIDDFNLSSDLNYYKDFTMGYPVVDELNMEISFECYLNSLEAVGYYINGLGSYNTDDIVLNQDLFKFTPISKSQSEEIIFEVRNRLKRR